MPGSNPRRFKLPAKPEARTRVGNGTALFLERGVDGRSTLAKRYREILSQILLDIGGDPSEAQLQIARRATALAVWAESVETKMAGGAELDVASYTTAANSLRRLLGDLGLERRAVEVNQTLSSYLASRAAPVVQDAHPADGPAEDPDPEEDEPEHADFGEGGE